MSLILEGKIVPEYDLGVHTRGAQGTILMLRIKQGSSACMASDFTHVLTVSLTSHVPGPLLAGKPTLKLVYMLAQLEFLTIVAECRHSTNK